MKNKITTSLAMALALMSTFLLGTMKWNGAGLTFAASRGAPLTYERFVKKVVAEHKAPFFGKTLIIPGQFQVYAQEANRRARLYATVVHGPAHNTKVNQDRNPWPKIDVAAAVNPLDGGNFLIVSNDTRQFFSHPFYHVTTSNGRNWDDDTIPSPMNPSTSSSYSQTNDPDVAFDLNNYSFISSISSSSYLDFQANYANFDNQVNLSMGYQGGIYTSNVASTIDYLPCNGPINTSATFSNCQGQFDKAHVAVDTIANSPTKNRIYVYYSYFCTGAHQGQEPCRDGNITIPAHSSAILEAHADGAGLPFSKPALVSGSLNQVQFSSLVIDHHGVAHIFFEDFSSAPTIKIYESTLFQDSWSVRSDPVLAFSYLGLNNPRWGFRDSGTVAPGCAIAVDTAYCSFSASQVAGEATAATPDVYLAAIDTATGASRVTRVNNGAGLKDHFFPWAVVDSRGRIYVGWYDNRNDPLGARIEYFVGESVDGGRSFPKQRPVSDVAFHPCVGFPGCSYFNDYDELTIGPDDVVHATWTDTRDGVTQQLYTQALKW